MASTLSLSSLGDRQTSPNRSGFAVGGRISMSMPLAPVKEGPGGSSSSKLQKKDGKVDQRLLCKQCIAFFFFASGNIGLNVFNQWALNRYKGPKFTFPVFYTMWHMIVSAIAAYIIACCTKPETGMPSLSQLWAYKFGVFPIAYCTTISTWLNNESFTMVSLFLNQAIRLMGPLPTIFFSWLLAGKHYSWAILTCVVLICIGSGLACYWQLTHGDRKDNPPAGVIVCLISLVVASLKPVIAMIVMQGTEKQPRLDPVVVLFYDSALASVFMSIYWACSVERQESIDYLSNPATTEVGVLVIVVGASMAFVYNFATYYYVQLTSAVNAAVGANGVKIALIVIAAYEAQLADVISWGGVLLAIASVIAYTVFSFNADSEFTPDIKERSPEDENVLLHPREDKDNHGTYQFLSP